MSAAQPTVAVPHRGRAVFCQITKSHNPKPLRFVWHHIQPQEAGGKTEDANLVQLCDSCHYSVHRLLWQLSKGIDIPRGMNRRQLALARQGYAACTAAGTTARIPNEG